MLSKSLFNNYLLIAFFLAFGVSQAQTRCKEIKATIEVYQRGQKGEQASVVIDFKDQAKSSFDVTLLGPKGYIKRDIQESEINNLPVGVYTLVLTSKREEDGYCIKHFDFTIK